MKCSNHEAVIDAIMELYNQDRMEMSVVHGPYSVGKTYIARALQARLGKDHTIYLLGRLANESIHILHIKKLFSHYAMYPLHWLSSKEGRLLQEKSFYA